MVKIALRKKYLQERKQLSLDEVSALSMLIFKNFQKYFANSNFKHVHCFLPIQKFQEVDTMLFINRFWENDIKVFVPKIVDAEMHSVPLLKETKLLKNAWGILEPENPEAHTGLSFDLVITPLLYSDAFGNRIGYGKGFYDRFFATLPKSTLKVGLNYFLPEERIDDVFPTDIPLDYLVTPTKTLSFSDGISKPTK